MNTTRNNFVRQEISMFRWISLLIAVLTLQGAQAGTLLKRIHVDHAFRYGGGEWEIVIHGNDGDPDPDPEKVVMVVIDQPFPSEGGRATRPSSGQWNFLGVGANEDVWIIPQAFTPLLWPGWRTEGRFAEYFDSDPRLGFTSRFVKISLEGITYSGLGDGHFSIWSNQTGGVTKQWISSADGITEEDGYYFSSGHAHNNFGFSDPGVYRVDYSASAFLSNDGGSPPAGTNPVTSPVQSFYYAVGTYAEWKASYFEPHELVDGDPVDDSPEVAHYHSDTDQDGVSLLLEYAFNLSPVEMDSKVLVPGEGTSGLPAVQFDDSDNGKRLVIEYVRRRSRGAPRLSYHPEFSSSLDAEWADGVSETVSPVDATWERVRVVDPVAAGGESARFGRVRVELE